MATFTSRAPEPKIRTSKTGNHEKAGRYATCDLRIDVYRPTMLLEADVVTNGKAVRRRIQLFGLQRSALPMSPFGTSQTWKTCRSMSAFGAHSDSCRTAPSGYSPSCGSGNIPPKANIELFYSMTSRERPKENAEASPASLLSCVAWVIRSCATSIASSRSPHL